MNERLRTREIIIQKSDEGIELREFLARRFTYQSADQWKKHIEGGRVMMNGEMPEAPYRLRDGDRVSFTPPEYEEPPVNADWTILLEDDNFLFANKPPLLPCHPAGIYFNNTLSSLIARARPELASEREGVRLVNRLDRETSGIVIVAKSAGAAAFGARAMAERTAIKEYYALVEGDFPAGPEGRIEARGWLERDEESPVRKKLRFVADTGASAEHPSPGRQFVHTTLWSEPKPHEIEPHGISLVSARLHTGKTHQIRATLQSLGFPVVGDKLYGRDPEIFLRFAEGRMTDADEALLRMPHQALHCARIVMPAMQGNGYEIAVSPPPSWLMRY